MMDGNSNGSSRNDSTCSVCKTRKVMIFIALFLLVILSVVLFFNMRELKTLKEIQAGTYYTEQQCQDMFGERLNTFMQFNTKDNGTNETMTVKIDFG